MDYMKQLARCNIALRDLVRNIRLVLKVIFFLTDQFKIYPKSEVNQLMVTERGLMKYQQQKGVH